MKMMMMTVVMIELSLSRAQGYLNELLIQLICDAILL